jgi:Holliday junction resolvase
MAEKRVVKDILGYLRTMDSCFAWKEHGGMYSTAGIPDIICCLKGYFIAIEVKQPGNRLTKLQEITLRDIERAGGIGMVVHSLEEVRARIEMFHKDRRWVADGDPGICGISAKKLSRHP